VEMIFVCLYILKHLFWKQFSELNKIYMKLIAQ